MSRKSIVVWLATLLPLSLASVYFAAVAAEEGPTDRDL